MKNRNNLCTHYKKSSIQKKTLNPTWNDAFEFSEIYDADTEVVILVKDDNAVGKLGNVRGKSTPLGQATFTLNLLELPESGAPETHTLALGDVTEGNRKMKFRAQGELVLRVAWVKPTAEELDERLCTMYLSRLAFVHRLTPLLLKASNPRVISILSAGHHSAYGPWESDFLTRRANMGSRTFACGFYTDNIWRSRFHL